MRIYTLCVLSGLLLCSCGRPTSRLERALRMAGDNRAEMEKVLGHYGADKADSLKLKAAVFLIENMPGHYSVGGNPIDKQKAAIDSIYKDAPAFIRQYAYGLPVRESGGWQKHEAIEDIKTLDAEFLVGVIDEAFEMWATCPWLEGLSFADFCEFILPYRKFDEPLIFDRAGRDSLWREMIEIVNKYPNYRPLSDDLRRLFRDRDWEKLISKFNSDSKGDCIEGTYLSALRNKQFAIPATCDMVPAWSSYHGMHRWGIVLSPGEVNETATSLTVHVPNKVYRITYSHNPLPVASEGEFVPHFFLNPFYRDVTAKYTGVAPVSVSLNGRDRPRNMYLSVFTAGDWTPVAWASVKNRRARFADMGVNSVYMPLWYEGHSQRTADYPLLVDKGGVVTELKPDTTRTVDIVLTRKFAMKLLGVVRTAENVEDIRIEASNDRDFRDARQVAAVLPRGATNRHQGWSTLDVYDHLAYRYWRVNRGGVRFEVGEVEFLDANAGVLEGETIQADETDNTGKTVYAGKYDPAFDGDVLTSVESRSWFGLDLGEPRSVSQARYVGRTDKNYIEPGHTYELMMFDRGEWRSQGIQVAETDSVAFEGVPYGGFYWLRNLTEGKEERPFTWFGGKLRWY